MGNYNPHFPIILGQEWVPIQSQGLTLTPSTHDAEYGVGFTVTENVSLTHVFAYLQDISRGSVSESNRNQVIGASIYPEDGIRNMGPMRKVRIPASATLITGGGSNNNFYYYGNHINLDFEYSATAFCYYAEMYFDTVSYLPLLTGKRILDVALRYRGYVVDADADGNPIQFVNPQAATTPLTIVRNKLGPGTGGGFINFVPPAANSNTGTLDLTTTPNSKFGAYVLPNIPAFSNTTSIVNFNGPTDVYQSRLDLGNVEQLSAYNSNWQTLGLRQFDRINGPGTRALRLEVRIPLTEGYTAISDPHPVVGIYDMSLEVTYCEETRVASGVFLGASDIPRNWRHMRVTSVAASANETVTLTPGNYVVTLYSPSTGQVDNLPSLFAPLGKFNSTRPLVQLPTHPGYKVAFPSYLTEMDALTTENTTIVTTEHNNVPQLTLVPSGAATFLSISHGYGSQAIGQVYGNFTVTQILDDHLVTTSTSWPLLRFYARRYGDTSVPLKISTSSGSTASITPEDFDALDALTTDGWREVTLEFDVAVTMNGFSFPLVTWSATGETASNRWEVLGVQAPSISGSSTTASTSTTYNLVAPLSGDAARIGPTTYGTPASGSTILMGWLPQYYPTVSSTLPDRQADVSVFLSQRPPEVTGLTLTSQIQTLVGIGQDCDIDPCAIPSEIWYNQLTWTLSPNAARIRDTFDRTEASTWGSPDVGPAYASAAGSPTLSVANGYGTIVSPAAGTLHGVGLASASGPNLDLTVNIRNNTTAGQISDSDPLQTGVMIRTTGVSTANGYRFAFIINGTSTVLQISRVSASVETVIASRTLYQSLLTPGVGSEAMMRVVADGSNLRVKVWSPTNDEPIMWNWDGIDTTHSTGTGVVFYLLQDTPATGGSVSFTDLEITPPAYWFGYTELQRRDELDTDWLPIMKATNPAVNTYNDYEARTGIVSEYRIRNVNVYNFEGNWSTTVTGMVPEPGVYATCIEDGHVLIFTTNEVQDGSSNLAYSSVWYNQQVEENFEFAEAEFIQMQAMYNRDFYVAFRPLERSGDQFSRTVLVQAAAISPPTLTGFTALSDMAWDDVNYICVRDEDGNRWFANVAVPSGNVVRQRKIYLAPVQITELTVTPTPVDPDPWS